MNKADTRLFSVGHTGEDRAVRPRIFIRNHSAPYNVENVYLDNVTLYDAPIEALNPDYAIIQ